MAQYTECLRQYKTLNKTAEKNAVVFFGADWLSNVPIAELARDHGLDAAVYNRSIKGLMLEEAEQVLEDCVFALNPDKVFINLGENDLKQECFNVEEFAEKYEWLLYAIHARCGCKIYILSVMGDNRREVNERLKKIAKKYACVYMDVHAGHGSVLNFFAQIRFFLRTHPMTFCEAFHH